MNYWIFVVTEHKTDIGKLTSRDIYTLRMEDKFWGLGERTPNRKALSKGDKAVFYVGNPEMSFAGTASLDSASYELTKKETERFGHENDFFISKYGVGLETIEIWDEPHLVKILIPDLSFIENKDYWGTYFQGGVRQISEKDYLTITAGVQSTLTQQLSSAEDIENQSEFALEAHLEEFLFRNWSNVNWGSKLELYETQDQIGRQFPAGTWSIDFLAIDSDTGDFVVIELKKGKTSDAVVGQTLRYISYVREEIAQANQKVRGIIVAREIDDGLRYSLKSTPSIQAKSYQVSFKLLEAR